MLHSHPLMGGDKGEGESSSFYHPRRGAPHPSYPRKCVSRPLDPVPLAPSPGSAFASSPSHGQLPGFYFLPSMDTSIKNLDKIINSNPY